ncbi:MAG: hypothetical protein FJZ97_01070 [Chloroflexi bacterium]|nr:hypothetical protein [Chloroflexota bacterium]
MRVNKYLVPLLVGTALLGSVGIAQATGLWEVSGKQAIAPGGMTTSEDVRGWMTLQQIADGFGLGLDDLYRLAGVPQEVPPETALKDLEAVLTDFETSGVREALSVYLGEVPAPQPATEERAPATPTPVALTTPTPAVTPTVHAGPTPLPAGEILPAAEIKGRHTLLEISEQCAVPRADLMVHLGLPGDTNQTVAVKELAASGVLSSLEDLRAAVAELQVR